MQFDTLDLSEVDQTHSGAVALLPTRPGADDDPLEAAAQENLRHLVSVCVDSLEVLEETMDLVPDRLTRRRLVRVAAARAATRDSLARCLVEEPKPADERGTVAGTVYHWVNRVRIATSGKDPVVALIALEHAEDRVRRLFLATLRTKMPIEVEETIRAAFRQVLQCHNAIYTLTRQAKAAA